jgi:hypothetical protein
VEKAKQAADDTVLEDIQKRSTTALSITNRLSAMMVPVDSLMDWGHYLMSCFHQIHPDLWEKYQDESHLQIRHYMKMSKEVRAAEEKKKDKPQEKVTCEIRIIPDPHAVAAGEQLNLVPTPMPQQEVSQQEVSRLPSLPKGQYATIMEQLDKQRPARSSSCMSDPTDYNRQQNDPSFSTTSRPPSGHSRMSTRL